MSTSDAAIKLIDYMGDYDDYHQVNIVGPYGSAADRDADLTRLQQLPLGAPEYNGGYQFLPATMDAAVGDAVVVVPEQVARAGTVEAFFDAFHGWFDD